MMWGINMRSSMCSQGNFSCFTILNAMTTHLCNLNQRVPMHTKCLHTFFNHHTQVNDAVPRHIFTYFIILINSQIAPPGVRSIVIFNNCLFTVSENGVKISLAPPFSAAETSSARLLVRKAKHVYPRESNVYCFNNFVSRNFIVQDQRRTGLLNTSVSCAVS